MKAVFCRFPFSYYNFYFAFYALAIKLFRLKNVHENYRLSQGFSQTLHTVLFPNKTSFYSEIPWWNGKLLGNARSPTETILRTKSNYKLVNSHGHTQLGKIRLYCGRQVLL